MPITPLVLYEGIYCISNLKIIYNKTMPKLQLKNKEENPGIRLNRYLANSGVCTRREADKLIAKGLVEVNGKIITEMGYRVMPGEKVKYLGELQNAEAKQYILVNKPKECSVKESKNPREYTVYKILEYACGEKTFPTDMLDDNTTGVLLMTNDKELTQRLNNKKFEIYHLFLDKEVQAEDLEKLKNGIKINEKLIKIKTADYANPDDKSEIGIELHSTDTQTVPQLIKQLGYNINRIDRVSLCGLTKKNVPRGKWRFLERKEISFLRML